MNKFIYILFILLPTIALSQHTISGQVVLSNASPVCDVLVELRSSTGDIIDQEVTTADGVFTFDNQTAGLDYEVHFSKESNTAEGVTTFDILLSTRIILAITTPITSDFWSADVNGSGAVTALDLVLMRKVVLGIDSEFPIPAWAFDEPTVFPPNNKIEISNLNENIDLDIMGAKRGDLNRLNAECD